MKDHKRNIIKEILSGKINPKDAAVALKKTKPLPMLIRWIDNSYSLGPDRERMTLEELQAELGMTSPRKTGPL